MNQGPTDLADGDHLGADRLRQLVHAMVDVGSHLDLPTVLRRIVRTATDLVGARYGAWGYSTPPVHRWPSS